MGSAMSVRSTNVYEEKSLGIFDEIPGEQEEPTATNPRVWSKYLASHARRQLAFDMWWLGFALWLVCIIERSQIEDPATNGWFTSESLQRPRKIGPLLTSSLAVFSVLFELTSAYGTVGLSTGTPFDAFSLSGRFSTLGKLVVIAVMLRGRHRGLPVAIDRAVLLPDELEVEDQADWSVIDPDEYTGTTSFGRRRASSLVPPADDLRGEPRSMLKQMHLTSITENTTPVDMSREQSQAFVDSPVSEAADKSQSGKVSSNESAGNEAPVISLTDSKAAASSAESASSSSQDAKEQQGQQEYELRKLYGSDPRDQPQEAR